MSTPIVEEQPTSAIQDEPIDLSKTSIKKAQQTPSLVSTASTVCRICQSNSHQEQLISPCHCKGSMAYVHLSCLERWLNQSSRSYCELCMYHFNSVETKRYKLVESLRLWFKHPRNRQQMQSDLIIATLLTMITVGLVVVCILGLQYFVIEASRFGLPKMWTETVLAAFLSLIIMGYCVTIFLLVKDEVIPWYTWWKRTVDVKLLLTPSVLAGKSKQFNKPNEVKEDVV